MNRILAALAAASIILVACNGNDDDNVISIRPEDLTPEASVAAPTAEPTDEPAAATPADGADSVEVQGIVGAIDEAAGAISITRLQGADVDRVLVEAGTRITSAGGRSITLADLRPSDRIIARGTVEDGVLVASEITVGQVVPGADPGG